MLTEVSRNIGISRGGMESWNGATASLPRHFEPQTAPPVDVDFWVWVAKTRMATRFTSRGGDALNSAKKMSTVLTKQICLKFNGKFITPATGSVAPKEGGML
jgi:hypothetical protein